MWEYLPALLSPLQIVTGAVAMELSRRPTITINEIEQLLKKFSNEAGKPGYDSSSNTMGFKSWKA